MIPLIDACVAQHWISLAAERRRARESGAAMEAALAAFDERAGR